MLSADTAATPILQFGTSRFLQAHVDLFVSEAMDAPDGEALGGITVVQTTASAESAARVAALAAGDGYPVRVRGLRDGQPVDETVTVRSVKGALQAERDWPLIVERVAGGTVQVIVSNTGDSGYRLDPADGPSLLAAAEGDTAARPPRSFPAKLLVLLHARWQRLPDAPLSIFPCELVSRNGETLRELVAQLAADWALPADFGDYLRQRCLWANSLVDRIVSEPIQPVGAVAEPYALWAIERQPGLAVPCRHPSIVLTDDLSRYERLKLYLLNLGHSVLAEGWLREGRSADETVVQALSDARLRAGLEAVWADEVVPVLAADGLGDDARDYLVELRDRLLNPYLAHRLADIAQNHAEKKRRRFAPVIARAEALGLGLAQTQLKAGLASGL